MAGGINIRDGKVGANVLGGEERNSALLLQGVSVVGGVQLGLVYFIYSRNDAKDLGINPDYDTYNDVRVYYHIKEFYRLAGEGTRLALMLVPATTTMEGLVEDTSNLYAKKILTDSSEAGYPIHQLAVGINPPAGYTPTIVDGNNEDVLAAISAAKLLTDWANAESMDLTVLLEGRDFSGTATAAQDFKAEGEPERNRVGLVIAQDYDYADTLSEIGKKHAAIGIALGAIASRAVNESIGWVEEMNVQDQNASIWLTAGTSAHVKVKTLGTAPGSSLDTLVKKGYLLIRSYPGTAGLYFASDFTLAPTVVDEDGNVNIHSISQSRTSNKLMRNLRKQLMPRVQSVVRLNSETGKLDDGDVLFLQDEGNKVFERASRDGEIVSGRTIVDPNITTEGALDVSFEYVKTSILGEVNGTINQKLRF
jgi:hypothetical protein